MTITDKQVEAACHAQYGVDTWPLFKQWERESFRKQMRAALEAAEAARDAALSGTAPPSHGVIYATVRCGDDGDDYDIECRFANGEKYAAVKVDSGKDGLADWIARALSAEHEARKLSATYVSAAAPSSAEHAGDELHPATRELVNRFSAAMADKLLAAQRKYGYSDGWLRDDWLDECRAKLLEHIAKGDPRDVANYCAFLWHHGASTAGPSAPAADEPNFCESCASDIATCDCVNPRPARVRFSPTAARAQAGEAVALTFDAFRAANVARCVKWHPAGIASWSPSDWLTAVTGELGELASLLKMRNRERDGLPGNKFSPTQKQIADEVADVLTYLDLLAAVLGVDLGNSAVEKFNEVSERVGFPDRIVLTPPADAPLLQLPADGAYLVRYDDTDKPDEFFAMTGARDGAFNRYRQISGNWNAHLYVKIDSNSRDVKCPSAAFAPPADARDGEDARRYRWWRAQFELTRNAGCPDCISLEHQRAEESEADDMAYIDAYTDRQIADALRGIGSPGWWQ